MGTEVRKNKFGKPAKPHRSEPNCLIRHVQECVGKKLDKRRTGPSLAPRTNMPGTLVRRQITAVPRTEQEQKAYEDLERRLKAFFDQHPPPHILRTRRVTQEEPAWWEKLLQSIARVLKN